MKTVGRGGFQKLQHKQHRQIHTQTDAIVAVPVPHSRVLIMSIYEATNA